MVVAALVRLVLYLALSHQTRKLRNHCAELFVSTWSIKQDALALGHNDKTCLQLLTRGEHESQKL